MRGESGRGAMGIMVGDVVIVVGGKAEASPKAKQKASQQQGEIRPARELSRAQELFFLLLSVTLLVCRGVGAGKEDLILHSLQTNLSTNLVDGGLGKGRGHRRPIDLGGPFQ